MKVLTTRTPSRGAASITFFRCSTTTPAVLRVGVERVGVVAEAGDGDAVLADQVADAAGLRRR